MQRRMFRVLMALLCALAGAALFAQSTGGRIIGRVSDPSGAQVSGAKITLINNANGLQNSTTSDASGDFSFPQVPVGTYTVTVDQAGFKQNQRKGVEVQLNQVLTLNTTLQVGSKEEVVNVSAEAPLVDTTSTQLGAVVNSQAVTGLPLNARNTYQLLSLQPGVQSTVGSDLFYGSDKAGAVSVNGGRGRSNNFTINGGDGNDLFVNAPAIQPSPDAIEEFRVITNTFDAEYGRNSGAVVNVVTKSGTNSWHGSAYEFFRNKALNSQGYFNTVKPDLKQNQFGGTFGGPIKKDKSFFFTSYEGHRLVQGLPSDVTVVPTAGERAGDFSQSPFDPSAVISDQTVANILLQRGPTHTECAAAIAQAGGVSPTAGAAWAQVFPNSQIPIPCMDPTAVGILQQFVPCPNADPNCSSLANAVNTFQAVPNQDDRDDQFTARVDHRINDQHTLTAYYYFDDDNGTQPFSRFQAATPNVLPGFGQNSRTRSQQANLSDTWTINSTSVNEARFTYFREAQGTFLHPTRTDLVTNSCGTGPAAAFCFTGVSDAGTFLDDNGNPVLANPKNGITPNLGPNREGVPFISVSGGFTIGNNFEGELPQFGNTYQFSDNFTKILGNHTMKFGVDTRVQRFNQTLFFDVNGDYSYFGGGPNDPISTRLSDGTQNLFPNYLLGLPDSFLQGSAQNEDVRTKSLYLFAQDSWKIRPNLTMNYGLRWELNTPLADAGHRVQTFRPGEPTTKYPCQLSASNGLGLPAGTPCNPGDAANGANSVFPLGLVVPGDPGVPDGLTKTYYSAFAPRIGIAWSPNGANWLTGGPGKMTIHAGFGLFYNPIEQLVLEQFSAEPPFGGSSLISNDLFNTPFVFQSGGIAPNPFNGILSPTPGTPIDWSLFRPILLFGQFQPDMKAQYSEQYNLTVQRELTNNMVFSIGYVGSESHRLLATHDVNFGNPQTCIDIIATLGPDACGPFFADSQFIIPAGTTIAPQGLHLPYGSTSFIPGGTVLANDINLVGLRPFSSPFCQPTTGVGCPADGVPVFSSIFAQDTIGNAAYNALQTSLQRRMSNGLQFNLSYTYSKSMDDASSFEQILNPLCFQCNWSPSLFDARHRVTFSYLWELPTPKYTGFKGQLLNNWSISGITEYQTGFPIRILSSNDDELMNSFDFELPGKPDLIAPFSTMDPQSNGNYFFNPTAFTDPPLTNSSTPLQLLGNAKRTICCGPSLNNTDLSIQKLFPVNERSRFEFRAEFFNILNHTQFLNPDGNFSDGSDFGRIKRARDPRLIQFALKYSF